MIIYKAPTVTIEYVKEKNQIMSDFKEFGFSAVAAKPYKMEELERTN